MKSRQILSALAGLVVVTGIGHAVLSREPSTDAQETKPAQSKQPAAKVIEVDDLAVAPDKFKGPIVIGGVVAKVNAEKGLFSIIDQREFKRCGQVGCARNYLSVKFEGKAPSPKTLVHIAGQVNRTDKGLVFEAKRLETKSDCLPGTLLANKDTLALTAEQVAKLTTIQTALAEAQARLQKKITHCQGELIELLEKKPVDQAKVDHEKKEVEELKCELAKEQRKAEVAARAVLTPEQAKRVPEPAEGEC